MVIMGLVQFGALYKASDKDQVGVEFMTFLLATSSFASAFMDVIVDALMVMQAKRDPESGTQDLVAFQTGVGVIASILGGIFSAW